MKRLILALAVALGLLAMPGTGVGIARAVPADPPGDSKGFGCYQHLTRACLSRASAAFDRARRRERVGPITLPTNFLSLSTPVQLMVAANLDRVDRGLPPIAGLSSSLQPAAEQAAASGGDPQFPSWTRQGGSNWYAGRDSLAAEFFWVYADGPGSGNLACTRTDTSGCWGHRHNVLGDYASPRLMGAGDGARGTTQLFLGADTHDTADVATWASELAFLPVGAPHRVKARHGIAKVPVWASGRSMHVRAKASAGWRLSRRTCSLRAGHECTITVRGHGRGTLTLVGPNGPVKVTLH